MNSNLRVLLLNQTFWPDVAATAQYAAELARGLRARGHEVTVLAGRRAYDDRSVGFLAKEIWHRVEVLRIGSTHFGKGAAWRRAADFCSFLLSCAARLATLPRFDLVIAMTTPPLLPVLAAAYTLVRGGRLAIWLMDLNPDEAVAAGWLREGSACERLLSRLGAWSMRRASKIVVLDEFMRDRVLQKGVPPGKISVVPPWAHSSSVRYDPEGRERFRRQYGLAEKFVVMYSGNHSPCHPLDSLIEAAVRLRERRDIVFCFVGGGSEHAKVAEFAAAHGLSNIVSLPYQPLGALSASLSAADLHAVVMGDAFVGIVHPCKVYNILTLGIPFLYIGPQPSHVTEMLPAEAVGQWARLAGHADVDEVERHIVEAAAEGLGRRYPAEERLAREFSQAHLIPKLVSCFTEPEPRACEVAAGTVSATVRS